MTQLKIGTHDESFHCDEVLACVMLDVGGVFDHKKNRYDHHQHGFDKTMNSISKGKLIFQTKLSSAGLVYWFYREQIICRFLKIHTKLFGGLGWARVNAQFFYRTHSIFSSLLNFINFKYCKNLMVPLICQE